MVDLILRKRGAQHAGELGLFLDTEVFVDEFSSINQGVDITVEASQSRNPKQFRLFWALAGKIAKSGAFGDADNRDVVDYLLMKCNHVKYITNKFRGGIEETIPVPKSIRFAAMDQTAFNRLFNRALYIVITEILPDMPDGDLRAEVEKMAGVSTPDPEPPKRRRRERPKLPAPVSIIPAIEPVNAGSNSAGPAASEEPPPETQPTPISNPAQEPVTLSEAAPSPPPPAQPAPPPAAPVAGQAALPTNFETWRDWSLAWIAADRADVGKTDQDMMLRWNGERKLRNTCGVTDSERQPVFEAYTAAIEEKQKRERPI